MLEIGIEAPAFSVQDHHGELVDSVDLRDHADRLDAAGLHVLGISFDGIDENRAFAEKFDFPYRLLCDSTAVSA